ncbi:MAG TPA: helix-turn-helix domain-containing protein [Dongiaceae bacterium]|nr:helix-turn-helix domain-containing protein [Dongiaceae bacterium]
MEIAHSDGQGIPSFNFLLQPEFPLNALILASEALRIANQNSGRTLFNWSLISETGQPVRASNGMWMAPDQALAEMTPADYYLVFEGNLPTQRNSSKLLSQLRAALRFGATIGAVDTGAFALAQAGLIGERDVVLHWEAVQTFRERFPKAKIRDQIFLIDGQRIFCAGGVATLDLMLGLIGRRYGQALANEVANALVYAPRVATSPQRSDMQAAVGDGSDSKRAKIGGQVVRARKASLADRLVTLMERNLDFPLSLQELAGELRVSGRTIIRESSRRFGETPMALYLRIRLQAARNFLFYEEFDIKSVAVTCGFSYPSAFSRAFKQQFGQTPRAFREALRRQQAQTLRPEIRRLLTRQM